MRYKKYLYNLDDRYAYCRLREYIGRGISEKAYDNARRLLTITVNGVGLNDRYNKTVVIKGKDARTSILHPITLFAPYAMTYDPDVFQTRQPIGWPIRNVRVQDKGWEAVHEGRPSCISFNQDGFLRLSPYTSHCSAYAAWAARQVFGISLVPTQIGDWCHAAAEQRDIMFSLKDWWEKTDAVGAQQAANDGRLAIVAYKVDDPDKEGYMKNGHIAIVLPLPWQVARDLQELPQYPTTPRITDEGAFREFISRYGPEICQAGGLNFAHTVAANGFANYYPEGTTIGATPVDDIFEFFVYRLYTQPSPR